jgi:hypothetical protein
VIISANFQKKFATTQDTQGLEGTDSWKKPEVENLVAMFL